MFGRSASEPGLSHLVVVDVAKDILQSSEFPIEPGRTWPEDRRGRLHGCPVSLGDDAGSVQRMWGWARGETVNPTVELPPSSPHQPPEVLFGFGVIDRWLRSIDEFPDGINQHVEQVQVPLARECFENDSVGQLGLLVAAAEQLFKRCDILWGHLVPFLRQAGAKDIQVPPGACRARQPPEFVTKRVGRRHVEQGGERGQVRPQSAKRHPELVEVFVVAAEADSGVVEQDLVCLLYTSPSPRD